MIELCRLFRGAAGRFLCFIAVTLAALCGNSFVAAETVTYYYTSPLGTVLATTDGAGNVISTAEYRPYGQQVLGSPEDGIGYAGHMNDASSDLIYMQARYYDPATSRFVSVDGIDYRPGSQKGGDRYGYADGNPVNRRDATGQCTGSMNAPDAPCNPLPTQDSTPQYPRPPSSSGNGCSEACQRMRDTSDRRGGTAVQPSSGKFIFDGIVAGNFNASVSGMAALGGGVKATKGLRHADSNISIVTPALGLRASAETNLIKIGYDGNGPNSPPAKVGYSMELAAYWIVGGGVNIDYTPPYRIEMSVDVGAGAGASIHMYSVGVDIKENN